MRKNVFILVISIGLTVASSVESAAQYEAGDKLLNVGIGLGFSLGSGKSTLPPISLSYEHGFTDKISVGGFLGYAGSKVENSLYKINYTYLMLGARGSYHFYVNNNIDAYGGVLLGYNILSSKIDPEPPIPISTASSGLVYGFYVGGRYYFTEKIGAFAELGYGISYVTVGLAVKL
ncbi:MAG: outer membrane beta-barrel protein [Thermaurantimonas sp.]